MTDEVMGQGRWEHTGNVLYPLLKVIACGGKTLYVDCDLSGWWVYDHMAAALVLEISCTQTEKHFFLLCVLFSKSSLTTSKVSSLHTETVKLLKHEPGM